MPSAKPEPDFEALDSMTEGSNKFAVALYQALSKKGGNVIVSPVSVQLVLALVHQGAKGDTAAEIASALGLHSDNELVLRGHKSLIELLQMGALSLANRLFVNDGFELKSDYQTIATKYFLSSGERVPFSSDAEGSRKTINDWVSNNTNKKINDLLSAGSIDSSTRLVLVNAIHFKANWEFKFSEHSTNDQPFYLTASETVNVKMMHISKKLRYRRHEDLGADLLELPYEGGEMRMIIILPIAVDGLAEVERKLANINLAEEFNKLREVTVNLSLPKFKLEETIDLNDLLKEMGINTMFSAGQADLSGISETEPLYVSKAVQKAFIEVNEEGTEAAAATAKRMLGNARPVAPPPPVNFTADHPFLSCILGKRYLNSLLFLASVKTPHVHI